MPNHTAHDPTAGVAPAPRRFGVLAWPLLSLATVFGVLLFLCITVGFWRCGSQAERLIRRHNRNTCQALVDQAMIIEHWEKLETYEDFRRVVTDFAGEFGQQEYEYRFIRPGDTDRSGAPRDAFEQMLLDRFLKAPPDAEAQPEEPVFAERLLPGSNEYQYYQPIRAKESCLMVCHRPPTGGTGFDPAGSGLALAGGVDSAGAPLSEGDLMAVATITMPYGPAQRAVNRNRAVPLATAAIAVFLFVVFVASVVGLIAITALRTGRTACLGTPRVSKNEGSAEKGVDP